MIYKGCNDRMASDDIYDLLSPLLDDCMALFQKEDSKTSHSFVQSLKSIHNNAIHIRPIAIGLVGKVAHKYDASPHIKANGYRSLLALLDSLCHLIVGHLQTICRERKNVFFRANQYSDKLRVLAQNLHQMRALFGYAQILIGHSEDGSLFATEQESDDIMHDCEIMAKSCFYSHVQGFQFYPGIQPIIQALSMFTASYNDIVQHSTVWQTTKSLFNSGKYVVSPSVRGRQIEKIYSEAEAPFFKAFFSLPEMGVGVLLPNLVGDTVRVNRIFNLPPKVFELETTEGHMVEINRTSCIGHGRHVKARLISAVLREGQDSPDSPSIPDMGLDKSKVLLKAKHKPRSKTLLFFCHGGGFIALTSKSYEVVLREWSKELDCPIFSVDYSLAPDAPFPEAFEECFYAYAWALKNAELLGTTAEKVIFAGDSAGGNLVLSVAMRAAAYGIKIPDAMLVMYPSAVVRYSASPSRLLAVMDPLLPHCMLCSCLCAYTGFKTEKVAYNTTEHKLSPTDGNVDNDGDHTESCSSSSILSSRKQSVTDNSVITTFLQDVGDGLGRLGGPAEPEAETWWDDEIFMHESEYKPEASSQQRPSITNFFKDMGRRFSTLLTPETKTEKADTFWDDEFDMVSIDNPADDLDDSTEYTLGENSVTSASSTNNNGIFIRKGSTASTSGDLVEAHFKIKLANNFSPLKSRYFGERTKVHHTALVKNPYISPALAPDEMLRSLPYLDIVGCELDPLFDDSVTLARRLHKIGHQHQFHVVRGLPHGFLSLQMCRETKEASKMCLELLKSKILGSAV
ncbi:hormone-sensitive lipase-like isoform X1 [Styela clava]